jgi:hypothetical protein
VIVARIPVAAGVLLCALAAAGCGLGPGPSIGDVKLVVTRDYGARRLLHRTEQDARQSETVLRLLDRSADISTRYGGGFVKSINGLAGDTRGGRGFDWFFYVNGVESPVGAAEYRLHPGDRIWWDYRDWTAAMRVPAVVGSYPEPFLHGYLGQRHPVRVRCLGRGRFCERARTRIRAAAGRSDRTGAPIRVLVGTWKRLQADPAAALIDRGPAESGVFAEFARVGRSWRLRALDAAGQAMGPPHRAAGLVAATRDGNDPPTWLVTGTDAGATDAAARLLGPEDLRDRYAVAVSRGHPIPLPVR